jgi:arginase
MAQRSTTTYSSVIPRQIRVIGVPLDLGQSRRGVDMGPSAVRVAGLEARLEAIGHIVEDAGNIAVALAEQKKEGAPNSKYLKEITATCIKSADLVLKTLESGKVPLILGGDHSVAAGTVSGVAEFYRRKNQKIGLIWIDAHTDMNTPDSSPSGNVHGMPLAAAFGVAGPAFSRAGWPTRSVLRAALLGVRSLDDGERALIGELDVRVFTMSELDRLGVERAMREALAFLEGASFLHTSVDLDAVDPMFAPGVGTPVRGGLSYREAHLALELVAESGRLDSLELVEVNPILDRENETAALAVELAASALGARIL